MSFEDSKPAVVIFRNIKRISVWKRARSVPVMYEFSIRVGFERKCTLVGVPVLNLPLLSLSSVCEDEEYDRDWFLCV